MNSLNQSRYICIIKWPQKKNNNKLRKIEQNIWDIRLEKKNRNQKY